MREEREHGEERRITAEENMAEGEETRGRRRERREGRRGRDGET